MTEEEYHQQEQDLHHKINKVLPGSSEEQELLKELDILKAVYAAMQASAQKEQGLLNQLEDLTAKYAAAQKELEALQAKYAVAQASAQKEQGLLNQLEDLTAKYAAAQKELEALQAKYAVAQASAHKEQGLLNQLEDLTAKNAAARRKARVWRNSGLLVGMVSLLLVVGGIWGPDILQRFNSGPTPTPIATLPPTSMNARREERPIVGPSTSMNARREERPISDPPTPMNVQREERPISDPPTSTPVPTPTTSPVTSLRREPGTFSPDEITDLVQTKGFYEKARNPSGNFQNVFTRQTLNGDRTVIDHTSGLMWEQGGSPDFMTWQEAHDYVGQRNRERYAGFSDWRLPTIEELASLLEPEKQSNYLHINPIFDDTQKWCWSADKYSGSRSGAWRVNFLSGLVYWLSLDGTRYVRAVRSWTN